MRLLKRKVYIGAGGYKKYENSYIPVCDFIVNYYIFGILMHSVTVRDMDANEGKAIYKEDIQWRKKD